MGRGGVSRERWGGEKGEREQPGVGEGRVSWVGEVREGEGGGKRGGVRGMGKKRAGF